MMKGITLERLEVLKKLGEGKGVLGAAEGSKSRQGLFSRQLRELEEACGMTLIQRGNRRLQLNQKGEAVVERYQQLLVELGKAVSAEEDEETLRIGGGEVALVEGVIPRLSDRFGEIESVLQFRNLRSADAIGLFRRGELDLVLSSMAPEPLRLGEECRMLCEVGYIIVTSSSASQSQGVFSKTLLREKLVLLEGKTPIRAFLESESRKTHRTLRLGALCSTYGQILNLVEKGGFVGVIPSICSPAAKKMGLFVKQLISEEPPSYQFWLLYRKADFERLKSLAVVLKALGGEAL